MQDTFLLEVAKKKWSMEMTIRLGNKEEREVLLSCISYGLHTKIEDTLRPKRMQWRLHAAVGLNHH